SDAASATLGCSVNSAVAATYTPSLTTWLTRFNECGAHLRGGRRAEGLTAAAAGEAAWFGGAKRAAEPGCERSERRILADARSVSARTPALSRAWKRERSGHCKASAVVRGSARCAPWGRR